MMRNKLLSFITLAFISYSVSANEVEILTATVIHQSQDTYSFNVELQHQDTGWEHYADTWRIVDQQGNILGTRVLYHPHVEEQPFTRSLNNVNIAQDINTIYIEAHDKVHGWSKHKLKIDLQHMQDGKLIVEAQ